MKKVYTIATMIVLALLMDQQLEAQGIHKFWGLTAAGGKDDEGVIFTSKPNGTAIQAQHSFKYLSHSPGGGIWETPLVEYNGKWYGSTTSGGLYGEGTIFEYDMVTEEYKKYVDLFTIGGGGTARSLTRWNNKLYGTTSGGGTQGYGILFEFDLVSKTVVKKYDFASAQGRYPNTPLCLYNGKLYGVTQHGGANNYGTVFQYDPATGILEEKADLHPDNTGWDMRSSFRIYGNKLYATCMWGGVKDSGTIIEFNPQTNALVKKADFDQIGIGRVHYGGFTLYNGKFYGASIGGGIHERGVIFEFNPASGTLVKKTDFTVAGGHYIYEPMAVYGNKLYGVTTLGGNTNEGVLFEYDPVNNIYTKKVNFGGAVGINPIKQLFNYNNKLIGITREGGLPANGVLFEYDPQINGIKVKGRFRDSDGRTANGDLTLYKGKLYGVTEEGGENGYGVIFSYDMATRTYTAVHHMEHATGRAYAQGGLTLHNNKLYGVTYWGGVDSKGVIFELDPETGTYTKKFDFANGTGKSPRGKLTSFNNKLYGTTSLGGNSDGGVIFVYDPATNSYSEKVHLSPATGIHPYGALTLYNGKLYGTTPQGGTTFDGTIFEYDASINGIIVRHNFNGDDGRMSLAGLALMNGKLYGTTFEGKGEAEGGTLFEYNPSNFTFTKKKNLTNFLGKGSTSTLLAYRGRLYGLTMAGGAVQGGGSLFEYIPDNDNNAETSYFDLTNGRWPRYSQLITAPAPTAHGTPGACVDAIPGETPNAYNQWMSFTDEEGDAVVEIHPNGNILGRVTVRFYVHNGATRKDDQGNLYLNRNITIEVQNQPIRPVQVRLYIRGTEFKALAETSGSGVINPEDITVFKNSDPCSSQIQGAANKLNSTVEPWGFDYVYTTSVESFSSFYFASNAISTLPIDLEYFKGSQLGTSNKLEWKASCTNDVDFIIGRSTDGVNFQQIGMVWASQGDCDKPFTFFDDKAPAGNSYYRLKMDEKNGDISYSNIILLSREQAESLQATLFPNPVTGSQATLRIHAPGRATLQTVISDITGRVITTRTINITEGLNTIPVPVQQLPAGIYQLRITDGEKNQVLRFVKQ